MTATAQGPAGSVADIRIAMMRNGYSPIPCRGKAPSMAKWEQHIETNDAEILLWDRVYPYDENTGFLTRNTPVLDVDITAPNECSAVWRRIRVLFEGGGEVLCRIGNSPRFAVPFRTDKPFKKMKATLTSPDGTEMKLELLCDGQQCIAFGRHPTAGVDYRWWPNTPITDPTSVPRTVLPFIDEERARELLDDLAGLLVREFGYSHARAKNEHEPGAPGNTQDALIGNIITGRDLHDSITQLAAKFVVSGMEDGAIVNHLRALMMQSAARAARPGDWQDRYNDIPRAVRTAREKYGPKPKQERTEWKPPKPLPNGLMPVKPFDVAMLPAAIMPWVEDIAERMQCPPDYVAVSAVVAMGAVIGSRVGIKPKRRDDWLVVPNLWGCIVGPPGYLKSPAMNDVLKPLRRMEAEARKENNRAAALFQSEMEEFKKSKKQRKDDDTSPAPPPEKPAARRYLVNDTSYEALGVILADNPNGVLAFRDELMSLVKDLDKEERQSARGFFLQAWNGTDDYVFDRILRGSIYVPRACVSLFGSTQPGIITEYVRRVMAAGGGDGMLQRFQLLVWPDGLSEWINVDRYPIAEARTAAWELFNRLNRMTPADIGAERDEFGDVPFLRFDEAAQELFNEWRGGMERRLRSGELHPAFESHLAKYRKLVPALALISAVVDRCTHVVDAAALSGALAFTDYLESHARRVYAAGREAETGAAKEILRHIRRGDLSDGFTCRDIHQRGWSHLTSNDTVQSALDLLVNNDWLAEQQIRTAGRPKLAYLMNPAALAR